MTSSTSLEYRMRYCGNPTARKIAWVIEMLCAERPRCISEIELSCGWKRRDIDDAVYELVRCGALELRPDSSLVARGGAPGIPGNKCLACGWDAGPYWCGRCGAT